MAPKETQAGSVVSGGVSGDVNMFTGTFNAAYDLGSVTTLSGLSFSLSMSYNSTFASGDNVPLRWAVFLTEKVGVWMYPPLLLAAKITISTALAAEKHGG